jgi:hypothetical protein
MYRTINISILTHYHHFNLHLLNLESERLKYSLNYLVKIVCRTTLDLKLIFVAFHSFYLVLIVVPHWLCRVLNTCNHVYCIICLRALSANLIDYTLSYSVLIVIIIYNLNSKGFCIHLNQSLFNNFWAALNAIKWGHIFMWVVVLKSFLINHIIVFLLVLNNICHIFDIHQS